MKLLSGSLLLTCLAPQCTDVGSAHPLRYVGPPTSPQRLAGRVAEKLPSWKKVLLDFGQHSQTSLWLQSAPTLQKKVCDRNQCKKTCNISFVSSHSYCCSVHSGLIVVGDSPSSLVFGPVPLSTSSRAPGSLWGLSLNKETDNILSNRHKQKKDS